MHGWSFSPLPQHRFLGLCLVCPQTMSYVPKHPLTVLTRAPIPRLGPGLPTPLGCGFHQGWHLVRILSRPRASPSPGMGTEKAIVMLSMAQLGLDLRRAPSGNCPIEQVLRPPLWVRMSVETRPIQGQPTHAEGLWGHPGREERPGDREAASRKRHYCRKPVLVGGWLL